MRHTIESEQLGPQGPAMAAAVGACVHCGFCLPTCPTYVELGEEMDSPRGRIFLIKEVLEGKLELDVALPYIDNCLGCLSCQTACPSGVGYGELLNSFRAHAEQRRTRDPVERIERMIARNTLARPQALRAAARVGRPLKRLGGRLPARPAAAIDLLPQRSPKRLRLPAVCPAVGERRARVALLAGCAQQALAPAINAATLRVLAINGVETVIPQQQGCCGALALHGGEGQRARKLARRTIDTFPDDVDAVITNAAGCGSAIGEYALLLAGSDYEERAQALAQRTVDVSVMLSQLGLRESPPPLERELVIAYQDACHLAHAQRVRSQPRELLRSIAGVSLAEPSEWQLCCGSAGTYNLERPAIATALGQRKAQNLKATGAEIVATGNIGCLIQLRGLLGGGQRPLQMMHFIEVLDRAYRGALLPVGQI